MSKLWLIFINEYKRHVLRRRFLFALLSMPLVIVFTFGAGILAAWVANDPSPIGYVDQSGLLSDPLRLEKQSAGLFPPVTMIAYADEEKARNALTSGEIIGFYVLEADYLKTGNIRLVANKPLRENAGRDFSNFIRLNLTRSFSPEVSERLADGMKLEVRTLDGQRSSNDSTFLNFLVPIVLAFFFMIAVNVSGGYVVQALVEEKENRTMEIVVTSVSPTQLMAGKVLGDIAIGLTQLIAWILFAAVAAWIGGDVFAFLEGFKLDWGFVALTIFTLIPSFVMIAGMMAIVGATAIERTEAQQAAGLFTLPIVIPLWFMYSLMAFPNSPLAVGLSIFPLTAPISLPIRAFFTDIPWWQILISETLLILSAIGSLWLAGRAFRLGMLRYGKPLSLREVLGWRIFRRGSKEAAHG